MKKKSEEEKRQGDEQKAKLVSKEWQRKAR